MASAETKQDEKSEETDNTAQDFKIVANKENKLDNSWQTPVISSAKSAFDRLLSRGDSSDKSAGDTSKVTMASSNTMVGKRKRK